MNLAEIIGSHPDEAVALRFRGEDVTYGDLRRRAGAVRAFLADSGIGEGERVALLFGPTPDFAVAYFGVLGGGAVAVPLNPNSPLPELVAELSAVRASLVLVAPQGDRGAVPAAEELTAHGFATVTLDAAEGGGAGPAPLVERSGEEPAVLLFTSGTAGPPKAAVLTHGSLLANIEQVELRVGLAATADDVGLLAVPPYHILGLNAVLGVQLYAGGRLVMLERVDPASLLAAVASERVTILVGVPQLFSALASYEEARGDELASVRLACSGAAPLPPETAEGFERRFGLPVWQGYGLTEASPTVTFPDLSGLSRPGSVGLPLPGVELRVVDADGEDVDAGDPGEILVRGPNVFAGYFEDPRATSQALDKRGWLHTGDVAVMSEEGVVTIVDRRKDLIIVSGFNVFPAEVEQVLEAHPKVVRAAVVGVPDERQGESVGAFVVPVEGAWESGTELPEPGLADELVSHCRRYLARYKCPATVSFVRELPSAIGGKVLRRAVG